MSKTSCFFKLCVFWKWMTNFVVHVNKTAWIRNIVFSLSPDSEPSWNQPEPAGRPESQRARVAGKIGSFCRPADNEGIGGGDLLCERLALHYNCLWHFARLNWLARTRSRPTLWLLRPAACISPAAFVFKCTQEIGWRYFIFVYLFIYFGTTHNSTCSVSTSKHGKSGGGRCNSITSEKNPKSGSFSGRTQTSFWFNVFTLRKKSKWS